MSKLIPVIYRNMNYPSHIEANIHELSGNFYKEKLIVKSPYSLHTECSHGERNFNSKIISDFAHIRSAQKKNVPQLWHNKEWAKEFFKYLEWFIGNNPPPDVLEIHPPFNDYCDSLNKFIEIFVVFYQNFIDKYPTTTIIIENRFGTRYKGGNFILSTCMDILLFCRLLNDLNIKLKIALDYPQIFSAEITRGKTAKRKFEADSHEILENIITLNFKIKEYSHLVGGFHMWGKLKSKDGKRLTPHAGNLDNLFNDNKLSKEAFLNSLFTTFNDDIPRYFVPEVNSGVNDFHSIVADMEQAGFTFISKNNISPIRYYSDPRVDRLILSNGIIGEERELIILHQSISGKLFYCFLVKKDYIIDTFSIETLFSRLEDYYYKDWELYANRDFILDRIGAFTGNLSKVKPTQYELDIAKAKGSLLIDGDRLLTKNIEFY